MSTKLSMDIYILVAEQNKNITHWIEQGNTVYFSNIQEYLTGFARIIYYTKKQKEETDLVKLIFEGEIH